MPKPLGKLHPGQYEILQAIWEVGPPGATTLEIWERIAQKRTVVRTTVLNVVDRLEKRGWLTRQESPDGWRYWPTSSREQIEALVAADFVQSFFQGSASELVLSLIGQEKVPRDEIERLREIVEQARTARAKTAKKREKRR
jgi:BlaI family transcriptional regulator, penicillinase repressor